MTLPDASKNMQLLAHNDLGGFGNVGEGMCIQLARDGGRVLWLAHESAPKNHRGFSSFLSQEHMS